jgi:hypothetical protein
MVKWIESVEELEAWEEYRQFLKDQLKLVDGEAPIFVSKLKRSFEIEGKPWKGHAVLAGPKAIQSVKNLKKEGVLFLEGTVRRKGKDLDVEGILPKLLKESQKTFLKLRLGYKIVGVDEADDAGDDGAAEPAAGVPAKPEGGAPGELAKRAETIQKAVLIWNKTEQAVTKELRKLQKAILAFNDPRGRAVIQGLENILTRLDKVDDEAREAADAARRGDADGFAKARDDFRTKMNRMLEYVKNDELIRDADQNPAVEIKIGETLTKSLNQLMKVV